MSARPGVAAGREFSMRFWTWAALLVAAALAWVVTVGQAGRMDVGMGLALPAFLGMWVPMMAAMMFPALAPVAFLWGRSISGTSTGPTRMWRQGSFVAGYLVVWTAFGLLAFGLLLGAERLVGQVPGAARWIGASVFLVAGLYQLTPLKRVCIRHCRSPLGLFLRYGSLRGRGVDLRVGLHHGGYCVGCCWALMLVLIAVGVMNLVGMVALAALIFLEKVWRHGMTLVWIASAGFLALAVLALFYPALLPGLIPPPNMSEDMQPPHMP